ncbi:MAG TPA: class II glutamine amidotransferase [Candidatus Bilamarchaeum sp.]|nr:class II glutamine amidotransferase [Candidatus Bilamarchaeum sp.]
MCELLGMSFSGPVAPSISFTGFRQRGEHHPDGWGIAFYPDSSAQVFKEPIKAGASALSGFLRNYSGAQSKIIIGHVRKASVGSNFHKNTHPFQREVDGKDYVLAHNGTLKGYKEALSLTYFHPVGDTDSEHAFCHLMDRILKNRIKDWKKKDFEWLVSALQKINAFGTLNTLFSDGEYLFAYRDKDGKRDLHFTRKSAPSWNVRLLDRDFSINLDKNKAKSGYVIATCPLTDEKWESFGQGELIVFRDGEIVFRGKP